MKSQSNEMLQLTQSEKEELKRFFKSEFAPHGIQLSEFAARIGLGATTVRKCVNQGLGSKTNLAIILEGIEIAKSHPVYRRFVYDEPIPNPFNQPYDILPPDQKALTIADASKIGAVVVLAIVAMSIVFFVTTSQKAEEARFAQLMEKLQSDAVQFFRAANSNEELQETFSNTLKSELDPELRVPHPVYGEAGLLFSAVQAGNFRAASDILAAGASPHSFQDLRGTTLAAPFFLFPVHHVASSRAFSGEEKRKLLTKMFRSHVTFHEPMKLSTTLTPFQTGDSTVYVPARALQEVGKYTNEAPVAPTLSCAIERDIGPCNKTRDLSRADWCGFAKSVPAVFDIYDKAISDIRIAYVQDLISISGGSAFFYVTHLHGWQSINGVLEALPEDGKYRLYTYGNANDKIRGHCRSKEYTDPMGYCWRYFDIEVLADNSAKLDGKFDARTIPVCTG